MRQIALVLLFCFVLTPVCFARSSSSDRFLNNLTQTWDSFLEMTEDAGKAVSEWADESGVTEWAENTASDISAWAKENGLTDWAESTVKEFRTWFDESGISEWTAEASQNIRDFAEENRPAVEAWLREAGEEVRSAWNTLMDADHHTGEELQHAYESVMESLEAAGT